MPDEESMIQDLREIEQDLRNNDEHRKANVIDLFIRYNTHCKIPKEKIMEIIKQLDIDIERNARRKLDSIKETGDSIECTLITYDPEIVKYRLLKLMED